jgi:acetyl-CoA C-acetyltransferase
MNANAFIDQAAALVLTSVGFARRLGIDRNRWVYLHGCADAHDHWYLSERMDLHRSPAIRLVSRNALEMARIGLADIDAIDLYSCFASAVAVACEEIGLSVDDPRGLTITGGLPYFGGPGNNYVTHSIAQMMHTVRARPGSKGLVTANGNYLTKHSAGIYSTEPPSRPFSVKDTAEDQALLDRLPRPKFVGQAEGSGQIDTYTVMFERDRPVSAIVLGHLDDGSRFIANTAAEVDLLNDMCRSEYLGRIGRVSCDGERNLFRPS